jgi:hypothetical protein
MEVNDDRNGFLFVAIFGDPNYGLVQRGLAEVQMVWFLVLIVFVLVVCFTFS